VTDWGDEADIFIFTPIMPTNNILTTLQAARAKGEKHLAVLIDPDKLSGTELQELVVQATEQGVFAFLVGGSLLTQDRMDSCLKTIRAHSQLPVVLFPGSHFQVRTQADAILFLSLISGRNPDLLIGQQVIAAPLLKDTGLEILPTGYLLIDGGVPTTASYMSNSQPIPANKPEIAACTALAGTMLGLQLIYLDAGSGAQTPVSVRMIQQVRSEIQVPLIVGGGIRTGEAAYQAAQSGADLIVVGNVLEKHPDRLSELVQALRAAQVPIP
jgi:phosphoglycerol geranylgeranyltransferase